MYKTVPMYELVHGNQVVRVMDVIEVDTLLMWTWGYDDPGAIIEQIDAGKPFKHGFETIRQSVEQTA